jgi:glyoxylase-like metal-dependent hydrolase (beta-lactamase superfamily II)
LVRFCEDVGVNVAAPAPGGAEAVTDLGHEVYQIDTFMAGYDRISAGYLIRADRPCLVETGTAVSAPVVRDALARLGIGPADLTTVVVTHIHLDHAGGVGDIAQMFPRAEVVVHERGAPHLADPELLMASAQMVWGDRLDELVGTLAPTPAERIRAVEQSGTIDLGGGRRLESHYAPGHATHHISLVDSVSGDLYVGDAAGVYIPATGDLRPATPPPDFDLQTALQSLRTFAALRPARLLFSHYGPVPDVETTLDRAAEEINVWADETRRAKGLGLDLDHAAAMVAERTRERYAFMRDDADPELAAKYSQVGSTETNVAGISRWLSKRPRTP